MRLTFALGCCLAAISAASNSFAADIISADYSAPTSRYQHGILGDTIEYGAMDISLANGAGVTLTLPTSRVFEDLHPRLADIDADGTPEIIAIESSLTLGARLSIYDETGLIAATPYIGRSHRWLAPIGAADLDGDGLIEIAYIDRPHLAKTLRIWRYVDGDLVHVADRSGLTNHRIGWDHIPGGIRNCGTGFEMITASANWQDAVSSTLTRNGQITQKRIGSYTGPDSLNTALNCP